jgi:hypothetical protein
MSGNAAFRFLSSLQRGAAAQIAEQDGSSEEPIRVEIPVFVEFNDGAETASVDLTLSGPGDVTGFDSRAVVRTWPLRDALTAEPNYFPLVEFDQVDLPWRYTPRRKNAEERLRPWLCLIALKEGEDDFVYEPPRGQRALGKVSIAEGTPLPRLDQSWAWAHVQVSGDDAEEVEEEEIGALIVNQPERCLARILCPRRLDEKAIYWAMLVPTFEVGRRAGLRIELANPSTLGPAWSGNQAPAGLELPVYHRWRFGTGAGGDFESLVRELKPMALSATVGVRSIDITEPGGGLPEAAGVAVPIGGALQAPDATPWDWPEDEEDERTTFVSALATLLNTPDDVFNGNDGAGDPVVAPPLYGTWHARQWRLVPGQEPAPWFHDLNEDPRKRVAAALGSEVVQNQQHALMESAWNQLAGIREANDQLRKAQLARVVGERLYVRFIEPVNVDTLLMFTGAALGHVRHETKTIRALTKNSPPRLPMVDGAFRRFLRPLGPMGRRQERPNDPEPTVITKVNAGDYDGTLFDPPADLSGIATYEWMHSEMGLSPPPPPPLFPPSESAVTNQPERDRVVIWDPEYGTDPGDETTGSGDTESMIAFREAAEDFAGRVVGASAGETLVRLDLPALKSTVVAALDPGVTIPAAFGGRLVRRPDFVWDPPDPIEPVMAHPEFLQPMYKPLAEISQDWILPGLAEMTSNTVALAKTNPTFIEAYMVGLNHEMARELLWQEYPTDQRGSYFRQFWDPAGLYSSSPPPEDAKDITPLHGWVSNSELGDHRPDPPAAGTHLVLLVRGEVLRRYPSTLVYAHRAQGSTDAWELDTTTEPVRPVFGGRLRPDVAFFGFDLTEAQVRGGPSDPGWFFVFEEQPGEPKFGLDIAAEEPPPLTSWNDLAWNHLAVDPSTIAYIDLPGEANEIGAIRALEVAGGAAWHVEADGAGLPFARGADHAVITHQRPVRVAIHASKMLPG